MAKDTVEFKYVFDDDYRPTYANGAYGGKGVRGEIIMNFFTERWAIPKGETDILSDNGTIQETVKTDPATLPIIRTISCGVIMSKKTAEQVYEWLGKILEEYQHE